MTNMTIVNIKYQAPIIKFYFYIIVVVVINSKCILYKMNDHIV